MTKQQESLYFKELKKTLEKLLLWEMREIERDSDFVKEIEKFLERCPNEEGTVQEIKSIYQDIISGKYTYFQAKKNQKNLLEFFIKCLTNDTLEGYLAASFICHQFTLEILYFLLESQRFELKLSVFPETINFKPFGDASKFSAILQKLEETIWFNGLEEMLKAAKEINDIRNDLGHGLIKQPSLKTIKSKTEKLCREFAEFLRLFESHLSMLDASRPDILDHFIEKACEFMESL